MSQTLVTPVFLTYEELNCLLYQRRVCISAQRGLTLNKPATGLIKLNTSEMSVNDNKDAFNFCDYSSP